MSFLRPLFTGAAIIATGSVPGKIVHDASQADFSIVSCNENFVEIHGAEAEALGAGDILAYVGNDGSVCADCVPLFRKIVSRNDKTFETAFATFDEVFPEETYDATLANVEIESVLGCSHSGSNHRLLQGNATEIVEKCGRRVITSTMIMLLSVVLALSLILLPLALIGWGVSWVICPPLWEDTVYGAGSILIPNLNPSRRVLTEYQQSLFEDMDFSLGSFQEDFPVTSDDWTMKDSDGKCLYVDCRAGFQENCFDANFCANACDTSSNLLGFPVESNKDIDFSESCCNHNYCYASKFDKATCDSHFHKSMAVSCATMDAAVSTTFPLDVSTLSKNCNMLSFLIFLGVRVFGNNAYEASQIQQIAYNEAFCNHALQT